MREKSVRGQLQSAARLTLQTTALCSCFQTHNPPGPGAYLFQRCSGVRGDDALRFLAFC